MPLGERRDRLLGIFRQEVEARTAECERQLLALEKASPADRQPLIHALINAVHSLKGAAGIVEQRAIESVCHAMEDILIASRDQELELGRDAVQTLLSSIDFIREGGRTVGKERAGEVEAAAALTGQLEGIARSKTARAEAPAPAASRQSGSSRTAKPGRLQAPAPAADRRLEPKSAAPSHDQGRLGGFASARLDALLSQSGELLIARSRAKLRIEAAERLHELARSARSRSAQSERRDAGRAPGERSRREEDQGAERRILDRLTSELHVLAAELARDHRTIGQAADAVNQEVRRARLQPFSAACEGLGRLVRDLAVARGKEAELNVTGGEVEIDRMIVDALADILRHLVRNAVDHGLEPVEDRRAAGKPAPGRIDVAASVAGDRVTVTVSDDGRGLDRERIREQARQLTAEPDDPLNSIFLAGLSTSSTVTNTSGRGVGLNIVKTTIEKMRGAVDVMSRPGGGTEFRISLPSTLGTIRAVLMQAADQIFAIDTSSISRIARVPESQIRLIEGRMLVVTPTGPAPAVILRDWLELPTDAGRRGDAGARHAIILNEIGRGAVIFVDAILAEQDVLVRPLGPRLRKLQDYSGGSVLPDGTLALVINAARLGESALARQRGSSAGEDPGQATIRSILVADDSVTTRTLEKTILEGAGYQVLVASDGAEAWRLLQDGAADLVLADVDMPGLDGFALTEKIRNSALLRNVPVVLLTAREKEDDKKRGLEAGADAYLLKSMFDHRELLRTIADLI